jgi:hypothetical protein
MDALGFPHLLRGAPTYGLKDFIAGWLRSFPKGLVTASLPNIIFNNIFENIIFYNIGRPKQHGSREAYAKQRPREPAPLSHRHLPKVHLVIRSFGAGRTANVRRWAKLFFKRIV